MDKLNKMSTPLIIGAISTFLISIIIFAVVIYFMFSTPEQPITSAPTKASTTKAPTTPVPTTSAPTTSVPTTKAPTTSVPTTKAPTTSVPTTSAPTTSVPTTSAPTTSVPTTGAPTAFVPPTFQNCPLKCEDQDIIDKTKAALFTTQNPTWTNTYVLDMKPIPSELTKCEFVYSYSYPGGSTLRPKIAEYGLSSKKCEWTVQNIIDKPYVEPNSPCVLNCGNVTSAVQTQLGAAVSIIQTNKVADNVCDVAYYNQLTNTTDKRRFTLTPNNLCKWSVSADGGTNTGNTVRADCVFNCENVKSALLKNPQSEAITNLSQVGNMCYADVITGYDTTYDYIGTPVYAKRSGTFVSDKGCNWTLDGGIIE